MRNILFYRSYSAYTGGHQKVADYINHLNAAPNFSPFLCLEEAQENRISPLWQALPEDALVSFAPSNYDFLFLAGEDWLQYEKTGIDSSKPVISLIQGLRHAEPDGQLRGFLQHKAIRICVSPEVADAINATSEVNGPVFTIPNGIEIPPPAMQNKTVDVLIVGMKNPPLAKLLADDLGMQKGASVKLLAEQMPRSELLQQMAEARIVLAIPFEREGFYLPALEAMQLADLAVVPDCVGNRSFCIDGNNCLRPGYTPEAITQALNQALNIINDTSKLKPLKQRAQQTVAKHSLAREREAFLAIMRRVDSLWKN